MSSFDAAIDRDANRQIIPSNESFKLESTWTFSASTTGAIAQHTLFTVTGNVWINNIFGICDTDLESGGAATISIGTANNVAGVTAAQTATNIDDGDVWSGVVLTVEVGSGWGTGNADNNMWTIVNDGADITLDILTSTITAGVIDFYCLWRPLSSDGNITVTVPA